MTVTLTIGNVSSEDVNKNPKMQRLLCESVSKAAQVPCELIRLKDIRNKASTSDETAADFDFLITAPLSLFPDKVDPLDRVLQLLTTDPFLASTGPTVQDDAEYSLAAAIRRVKSEAFRGIGLRQSSGLRSKSSERPRARSRSGSATRPTILIEEKEVRRHSLVSRSFPVNSETEETSFVSQGNNADSDTIPLNNGEPRSVVGTMEESPVLDERRRTEREAFRLRIAAASKETANRMKKMEWNVKDKKLEGDTSAELKVVGCVLSVYECMELR
jgi:hypothetical protein